jgi:phage terminase large subunit GpA-like protein
VHGRIAWPSDQPGAWHLCADATDDFCEQITAESRIVKANGAVIWVRSKKANHYLDCEALNAAAAHLLGAHSITRKRTQVEAAPRPKTPAPIVDQNVAFRSLRREWIPRESQSGWVKRWK